MIIYVNMQHRIYLKFSNEFKVTVRSLALKAYRYRYNRTVAYKKFH